MPLNLLEIQPNKVSRDISSYTTLLFGPPKIGKSRLAAEFPAPIFFCTEPTQETIPGAYLVPVRKWSEMKNYVKQLKQPALKERFKTVVIDVIDLAATYCEEYICGQQMVEAIKDIPWGEGYKMEENEFRKTLYDIRQEGYGLVMISHVTNTTFTREDGTEYDEKSPTIPGKRLKAIAENLADIYGYIHMSKQEDGTYERVISLRASDPSTPNGNHFKYMPAEIPLSYEALAKALKDAIDQEEKELGSQFFVDKKEDSEPEELDFEALLNEFNDMVAAVHKNVDKVDWKTIWTPKIVEITDRNLGKGKKVSDATPKQIEQIAVIVDELRSEIENGL